MSPSDALYAFIVGVVVAFAIIVLHIVITAMTRAYFDVGPLGRALHERDPTAYSLLYRAKQHALRIRKMEAVSGGLKTRLLAIYNGMQPDVRYIRLERNMAKLTEPEGALTASKFRSALQCCYKDLQFLDEVPQAKKRYNFILEMIIGAASRIFLPTRDGVQEPYTVDARKDLKKCFEEHLATYNI